MASNVKQKQTYKNKDVKQTKYTNKKTGTSKVLTERVKPKKRK